MPSKILIMAICVALFFGLFMARGVKKMQDFEVNYKAGQRIIRAETLYRTEDGHYQFKYPPFCAMIYLPLGILPLPAAKTVWYVLLLASSIMIFILSLRLVDGLGKKEHISDHTFASGEAGSRGSIRYRWTLWVIPLLVLAKFYLRELELGQINAFIIFILLAMLTRLAKEEPMPASGEMAIGGLWGLATAMKPYALIFLPYFAMKKQWKALSSGFLILAAAYAAPSVFYGWQGNLQVHREWRISLSASTPPLFNSQDNISIVGFFSKWIGKQNIALAAAAGIILLIAGWTCFLVRKGRCLDRAVVLDCSLLLLLIPLISPLGWDYTLLSSAPAAMLLMKHFRDFSQGGRIVLAVDFAVIGLSLYDVMGRQAYASFMHWSVLTINFLILAGFLAVLRLKEKA